MRYVGRDELIQMIASALRRVPITTVKGLTHYDMDTQLRARVAAAGVVADAMKRLEVLTNAPEGPGVNYAAITGYSGVPATPEE